MSVVAAEEARPSVALRMESCEPGGESSEAGIFEAGFVLAVGLRGSKWVVSWEDIISESPSGSAGYKMSVS
jgi:hypothetical protein